jgi:hypothetical protein
MISQQEFLKRLTRLLDGIGIPYMMVGSVGSSLHGRPRATQDADVVIDPTMEQFASLLALLEQGHYVSREAANDALRRRTMFNILDLGGGWKADLIIRKDRPFSRQEFDRRRQIDAMGETLWVVSPEDAILSKLEWMKGRQSNIQYSDALGVAAEHWGSLDLEYLHKWARELDVEDSLNCLLREARERAERID